MCSLISSDGKKVNKAKRVNLTLKHIEYLDVLFNKKSYETQNEKNIKQIA